MAKARKKSRNKQKQAGNLAKLTGFVAGVFLSVWSVALIISCIFYNALDSGYNNATSHPVSNLLGNWGAMHADVILTWWGLALPIFLVALAVWGIELLRNKNIIHWGWRLIAWGLGVLVLATTLGLMFHEVNGFKYGGNIGYFFARQFMNLFNRFYNYNYGRWLLAVVFACLSAVSFNLACGITFKSWYKVFRAIAMAIVGLIVAGAKFLQKLGNTTAVVCHVVKPKNKSDKIRRTPKFGDDKEEREDKSKTKSKETTKPYRPQKIDDGYVFPEVGLLGINKEKAVGINQKELDRVAEQLEQVLQEFGVFGRIVEKNPGPVVTLYELEPAPGTKTARVIALSEDIARSMSAVSVRIAVVPGSNTIGIELPNTKREIVYLRELFEDDKFKSAKPLTVTLGKDIGGKNVYADLSKMPHLLVAGTTGSGKSVGVNSMIISLLYRMRPEECKLMMIDPKMLEFTMYNGIPHLLTPVITDPAKAVIGLKWAVKEMEDRYRAMAQMNVRNITGYNKRLEEIRNSGKKVSRTVQTGFDMETGQPIFEQQELDLTPLPYIVIVVDEMADLMLVAGKEVEAAIQRLAQMARAAGIHLIMSTQRPSVDVITGTIKANFPTRISFQVTSKIDSRTILGEQGAEQLLGMGDMLYMPAGQRPHRIHAPFVKDSEVEQIVEFIKKQRQPDYVDGVTEGELDEKGKVMTGGAVFDNSAFGATGSDDDLYRQAVQIVTRDKKVSTSYVQRQLRIGYNRAATIIERMESEGVITAPNHAGRREVVGG